MSGGIVGVNKNDGFGGIVAGQSQNFAVEDPFPISFVERIWFGLQSFCFDQELQKRIRGLGDEDRVARVGDELEAIAICFAGAGCEENAIWRDFAGKLLLVVE